MGKLQNSDYSKLTLSRYKNKQKRQYIIITIRNLQSFYSAVLFFNINNYASYGAYYPKVLKNMEKLFLGNEKILLISGISVQAQERYLTTAIDMRSEQTNRDAKTPHGITNFLSKQTPMYKWCMSTYPIRNIHLCLISCYGN